MTDTDSESGTRTDRVMLDIETLGLEPGAVVLSIGAVRWTKDGPTDDEFYRSISRKSAENAGLDVDPKTLEWWQDQSAEARQILQGGDDIQNVLLDFDQWLANSEEVWANSPAFDCVLLEAAYDAVGHDAPWDYYQLRDHRTLCALSVAPDPPRDGVVHDALDDARHQARVAAEALRRINASASEVVADD